MVYHYLINACINFSMNLFNQTITTILIKENPRDFQKIKVKNSLITTGMTLGGCSLKSELPNPPIITKDNATHTNHFLPYFFTIRCGNIIIFFFYHVR